MIGLLIVVEVRLDRGLVFPIRVKSSSGMGRCRAIKGVGDWDVM